MSFDNIPSEMRDRKQWVNFDLEDGKKIPYIAGNCAKASSNNPETWRTFEEAVADVESGKRQHIGYAFASSDPFVFIDIDEPQPALFDAFDSYSQTSLSGKGIHIICRGYFEGEGRHPKEPAVGLFQTARFCLMTGQTVENRTTIKDVDADQLQALHDWLAGTSTKNHITTSLVETPSSLEDEEVLERCRKRFDSFESLWAGNAGNDHSASDHALIAALADECESNEQVTRLWLMSGLCRPHRRNQKYVDQTLKKIRGKQEYFKLHEFQTEEEDSKDDDDYPCGDKSMIESMPHGTLRELAEWHYSQCRFPLQECSVVTALATAGTVSGRNYQIQGGGLNPWLILVGETGCGKGNYQNGMRKIFYSVANSNEFGTQHFAKMLVGKMASGEGLEDILTKRKRINSYFPEFHETWQGLIGEGKARHLSTLKQALLDLHGQATQGSFMMRRVKAFDKDDKEEKEPVEAPCLVVSGETTPEEFYGSMSSRDISNGWLQRFMIVDVQRKSISLEKNMERPPIPEDLMEKLVNVFVRCDQLEISDTFVDVEFTPEAEDFIDDYEDKSRRENYTRANTDKASNRGAMRALQIMGLFAIWDNPMKPVVTLEQAKWALGFVIHCEDNLKQRFTSGEIGLGQTKQEAEIMEILKMVHKAGKTTRIKMGISPKLATYKDAVPYLWLKRRAINSTAFATDRSGASDAFERCLKHMEIGGQIIRIKAEDAETQYGTGCGPIVGVK